MKQIDIDLSDSDELASALENYLAHSVCPASSPINLGPLEDVELSVVLPRGNTVRWAGRVIRVMGKGSYLVEVSPAPNLAWLGSLLGPEEFAGENTPMEISAELDRIYPELEEEALANQPVPGPDSPHAEPEISGEDTPVVVDPGLGLSELEADLGVIRQKGPEAEGLEAGADGEALADTVGLGKRGFSAGVTGIESEYSDLYKRINELSIREKRALARQGGKTARTLLIKDSNKTLHMFVIMNPKLSLEEVEEYSKLPGLSAEAIRHISKNRTWMASRTLVFNLVRNPATPVDIAVGLLPRLGTSEWRVLTNTSSIRAAIAAGARKLLFNK